jgi:hypothetical protein
MAEAEKDQDGISRAGKAHKRANGDYFSSGG